MAFYLDLPKQRYNMNVVQLIYFTNQYYLQTGRLALMTKHDGANECQQDISKSRVLQNDTAVVLYVL